MYRALRRNIALAAQIPLLQAEAQQDEQPEEAEGTASPWESNEELLSFSGSRQTEEERPKEAPADEAILRNLSICLAHWTDGRRSTNQPHRVEEGQQVRPSAASVGTSAHQELSHQPFMSHAILSAIAEPPPWVRI
jgi:hypothetical protein